MIRPPEKAKFAVDRPFFYIIIHRLPDNDHSYYSTYIFNGHIKDPIET